MDSMAKLLKLTSVWANAGNDDERYDMLQIINDMTYQRLKAITGLDTIDDKYEYIIVEVSIKRYNRLRNEGMQSYSQEGESITFKDDDFAEFSKEINQMSVKENTPSIIRFIDAYNRPS